MPSGYRLVSFLAVVITMIIPLASACRQPEEGRYTAGKADELPDLQAKDINGNRISKAILKKRYSFVQFLGPDRRSDEQLYFSIAPEFSGKINVIIIGEDPGSVEAWPRDHDVIIIPDENNVLRALFNVPKFGYYSIYDPQGRRIASGTSHTALSGSLRNYLRRLIDRIVFMTEMLIPPEGHALDEYEWLGPVAQKTQASPREYLLLAMFRTICEGCYSGDLVNLIKRIHYEGGGDIEVRLLVKTDFTEEDIINLSSQLGLDFSIETADERLAQKWEEHASSFGEESVNGIVFFVDRAGKVLKIYGKKDRPGDFLRICLELANREPYEKQD